ncbi:MAG TPA: NAD(P)-binding domain-containing protein, partial [Actinomycetota bacterium]
MDVAVLGMGRMGRALAGRLLEGGHRVAVWNRSKGKAGEIVSAGAREAQSVADA